MSWHPSRASAEALDPTAPSRYRSAVVQCRSGQSMLVTTDDGDERLVPAPSTPNDALVGARVLLANDYDWLVPVEPGHPDEGVNLEGRPDVVPAVIDLRMPRPMSQRASRRRSYLFRRRLD